jgi:hypothetical protein
MRTTITARQYKFYTSLKECRGKTLSKIISDTGLSTKCEDFIKRIAVKGQKNQYSLKRTTKQGKVLIKLVDAHERAHGHQVIIQAKERASISINQVLWNAMSICSGQGLAL